MAKKYSKTLAAQAGGQDSETDPISAATPNMVPPEGHDTSRQNGPPALQPMRLKVLYSIDDLLPNCLARAKDVVYVRVAHLDENTPVGFVDLKTCVLNIVYSSPEIMHHQGCDYSVYTYDYSEPDTPMTGLGLLSWVLSLPTLNGQQPDPDAIDPAQASRLVTGRVQKNLLGLFSGDIKETLEVRMRLCRVPTLRQVDYLNHMNQYSQLSQNIPPGVDPASVWTSGVMGQGGMGGSQYAQQQQQHQQHHGGSGGMAYPYMPQGVGSYQPMAQYQQPPPSHMGQPPQGYPQPYSQNLQPPYQNQAPAPLQQSHGTQAPSPANTTQQGSQQADIPEAGAPVAPSIADGPSPAPSAQAQQASDTPESAIGTGEPQKVEPSTDSTQPTVKKRRVSTKKPTGKPRGRPRLTDIRKSNTDSQPPSREGLPQDPAAADSAQAAIKQAPTPSSVAPSPSLTSVSTSNLNHTSASNILPPESNAGSPYPSLSQATPLPPPSSAAPSPAALAPAVSDANEMATQLSTLSPPIDDRDVEMTQDIDNDADTEIAESPRDSDVDSLFIGSSPPPSHTEAVEQSGESPALETSPVLPRQPSKGFFPSQPRQSSFSLQDALSRDDGSEDELALPTGGLMFPTAKASEKQAQDKSSPSEKAESPKDSPKDVDESASSTSQTVLPRKRGRPPKNPDLKAESLKKQKEKKSGVKTDSVPSDAPVPTSPIEQKPEQKPKSKKPPPVPMLVVPTPNLPSGLILPAPPSKENENPRKRRTSDAGSDTDAAPAKRGSTTALVRARIERQMLEKIAAGEMPTYCMHCGAIETPTWRKAKVMMTDPETGSEAEREVTLCNPCGLWHHNHGTMRPDQYWDKKEGDDKPPKPKKKKQKKRVCLAPEGSVVVNGTVVTRHQPCPSSPPARSMGAHRATSPPGPSRDGEWDQAVNKNLRRIQSSPCGLGTIAEPISLLSPDQKTRRKLFPEAKKSPNGLDGALTPGSDTLDPKAESMSPVSPEELVGSPEMEKENNPPPVDTAVMELDWERELERTLMEANAETEVQDTPTEVMTEDNDDQSPEDDESTPRPRTPVNQMTSANPEFKTPIRLTPLLASINVDSPSFCKFGMLGVATPSGKLISGHPTPTPGKLLMNMNMNTMSPATGEIMLEFLNEWNKTEESMRATSPTPATGVDEDNDHAFFSEINMQEVEQEMGLTSEGNAMPSSPPAMFNLYDEEPGSLADGISSSLFSDVLPTSPGNATTYTLDIGNGPVEKEAIEKTELEAIDLNFDFDAALVVDFSDLVPSGAAAKVAAIASANAAAVGGTDATAIVASEKKESSEDDSSSKFQG
ncbi:hypothetical protein TWF730_000703 [Orbilia blumenaviensis]|uniref:GATA-type domain-containing protein n=1 Tax=Orbilia blumenaviensis TaxID=1796055 RepID=A0AAV9VMF5_9PEZI